MAGTPQDEKEEGELGSSVDEASVRGTTSTSGHQHDGQTGGGPQLRLVKLHCDTLPPHQRIAIIDAVAHPDGVSIGRDKVYTPRIRIPAMQVSKHHANLFSMKSKMRAGHTFAVVDTGSTHGTFVQHCSSVYKDAKDADPRVRLSAAKQASTPFVLRHLTVLRVGDSVFQVHHHAAASSSSRFSSSCDACALGGEGSGEIPLLTTAAKKKKPVAAAALEGAPPTKTVPTQGDRKLDSETARRQTMKELRSQYLSTKPGASESASSYVDRAAARRDRLGWGGDAEPQRQARQEISQTRVENKPDPSRTSMAQPAAALDASNKGFKMFAAMTAAASAAPSSEGSSGARERSTVDPVMARGVEGRAGLGSKRLLDVEEMARAGQKVHGGYSAEASRERQRRRYEESLR